MPPRPASENNFRPVPVPSGKAYRVASPPQDALVMPALAVELERVLERFATEAGFGERQPVAVVFRPGVVGHHRESRAADIYAVGGVGLEEWKRRWDEAGRRGGPAGGRGRPGWRRAKGLPAYRRL